MFWRMPDVLCAYHLAMVRVTRLSRAWRAPHCFHALCVLRPEGEASASPQEVPLGCAAQKNSKTYATTQLPTTNQAGYSFSANVFAALRAVSMSPWKQCKKGAPPKPNEVGLVGRGGAAERLSFCPERQNEGCGACDDEARLSPLSFAVQRKMESPKGVS